MTLDWELSGGTWLRRCSVSCSLPTGGEPDKHFWSLIVSYEKSHGSGQRSGFTGWITQFMEGTKKRLQTFEFSSGLVTVPLTITDPSGVKDTSALVAGMLGFTVHEEGTSQVPSVRPFQGWCLLLPEGSPFRGVCSLKQRKSGRTGTSDKMGREEEEEQTSGDEHEEDKAQKGVKRKGTTCSISWVLICIWLLAFFPQSWLMWRKFRVFSWTGNDSLNIVWICWSVDRIKDTHTRNIILRFGFIFVSYQNER